MYTLNQPGVSMASIEVIRYLMMWRREVREAESREERRVKYITSLRSYKFIDHICWSIPSNLPLIRVLISF